MKKIVILAAMLVPFVFGSAVEAKPRHKRVSHYKTETIQSVNYVKEESAVAFIANDRQKHDAIPLPGERRVRMTIETASRSSSDFIVRGSGELTAKANRYVGLTARQLGLPRRLWCADFMNMITRSGSDRRAFSYIHRGRPAPYGCTNCVAVTARRGGGHVGVVTGYDSRGNPITISGNHGHKVGVGTYNRRIVIAYRYL